MIYKYTKCESVIAKIMADSDMQEKDMRVTDIREWIFEAVEKIGAPMQYVEKESGIDDTPILKLCDYQVPLPDDLVHLSAVAYSSTKEGAYVPMRTNSSNFKQNGKLLEREYTDHNHPCRSKDGRFMSKQFTTLGLLYTINGVKYLERIIGDGYKDDPTFFIKPGWIVTNKKTGYIKINYKAIATDERGYPLIPDTTSYQEAIYWYVMMKLNFPKYLKGQLGGKGVNSSQNIYFYLQQQWNFYRNLAYAEAMMPTESDMRSIKNEWNKLVPEYDQDEIFFKDSGKKQLNYTDYYYGY